MAARLAALPSDPLEHALAEAERRLEEAERAVLQARHYYQRILIEYTATVARREAQPATRLLTVKESAERLSLDESTVWRRVADGSIPSRSLGRSRRIAEADLMAWAR